MHQIVIAGRKIL